jgi:hypothetical protein
MRIIKKKILQRFSKPPAMSCLDYMLNSEAGEVAERSRRLAYPTSGNMLLVVTGAHKIRRFKVMS